MANTRKTTRPLPPVNGEDATAPSIPLVQIGGDAAEEEWDVLFTVDGKEYKLLKNPPASHMLTYLDIARKDGVQAAFSWAMEAMLSEDGYKVLLEDQRVSQADFAKLGEVVIATLLGADLAAVREAVAKGEVPKAPSQNGSRRPVPRR